MAKYKLTDEQRTIISSTGRQVTLHRIQAEKTFTIEAWDKLHVSPKVILKGDLGGWVESEANLSQDGKAWISKNACVFDEAIVCEDAYVGGAVRISGKARISGNAKISVGARIGDEAKVYGDAWIFGFSVVGGNAKIYGNAKICSTTIRGDAQVYGNAVVDNWRPSISGGTICGNDRKVNPVLESFKLGLEHF